MPLEALLHGANIVVHATSGISLDVYLQEPYVTRYKKYPFDIEELLTAVSIGYDLENPTSELLQQIRRQYSFEYFKTVMDKIMEYIGYINHAHTV